VFKQCILMESLSSTTMANQSRAAIIQANPIGDGLKRFYDNFDKMLKEIDESGAIPRWGKVEYASISQQVPDANRVGPHEYRPVTDDTVARIGITPFNTRQ
jgi:hypothetical protein